MTNGCLHCVALDIEDHVTFFYERLQLEPWDEFARRRHAEHVRSHMREPNRQTGRTLHGLLEAFALCVRDHKHRLAIKDLGLRHIAITYARRLGLDIEMVAVMRGSVGTGIYEDHHHG